MQIDSLAKKIISALPEGMQASLISLWRDYKYRGSARYCPVCGKSSKRFKEYGIVPRQDARCPRCGAMERHRQLWLFFEQRTDLFSPAKERRMLHVAPEKFLRSKLQAAIGAGYLTADLFNADAMVKMDITDIQYPDEYFDIIYCSHVLEHVLDDFQAMKEFYRVMKSSGWAVLNVPIYPGSTYENPSITDPIERERVFGQWDHVRKYGSDYIERLRSVGFVVERAKTSDLIDQERAEHYGLNDSVCVYYCRK